MPAMGLFASVEKRWIGDGIVKIGSQEVGSQAFGWLVGHLYAVLENWDRELVGGVAGEPEAELVVGVIGDNNLLTDFLQPRHPAGGKMAVLEHHPAPVLQGIVDHLLSYGALEKISSAALLASNSYPLMQRLLLPQVQECKKL